MFLTLPVLYFLTTAESCNCDTLDLTQAKEDLAAFETSKQAQVVVDLNASKLELGFAKSCNCTYYGDAIDSVSKSTFGIAINQDDPLMLTPKVGANELAFSPQSRVFTPIINATGCLSCTGGVKGGGRPTPPPPPPPIHPGDFLNFVIGPDALVAGKSDFTELNFIPNTALGRLTFEDLIPADGFKGTIGSHDYFSTSRNGYTVVVINLDKDHVLRVGSFSQERVYMLLKALSFK